MYESGRGRSTGAISVDETILQAEAIWQKRPFVDQMCCDSLSSITT